MKKKFFISFFMLACITDCLVAAEEKKVTKKLTIPAAALKTDALLPTFRYIDPFKIVNNLNEWQDELDKIKKEVESRQNEIRKLQEAYGRTSQELQSMGSMATGNAKEKKREKLLELENKINLKGRSLEEYAQRAQQEVQMKIFKKIEDAAQTILKREGLMIIFAGSAVAVDPRIDYSDKIVEEMNKKYKPKKPAKPAKKINE